MMVLLVTPQIHPPFYPGPAAYSLPTTSSPGPLMGEKLNPNWEPDYPAPNKYDIADSTGTATAKTFGTKPNSPDKCS